MPLSISQSKRQLAFGHLFWGLRYYDMGKIYLFNKTLADATGLSINSFVIGSFNKPRKLDSDLFKDLTYFYILEAESASVENSCQCLLLDSKIMLLYSFLAITKSECKAGLFFCLLTSRCNLAQALDRF